MYRAVNFNSTFSADKANMFAHIAVSSSLFFCEFVGNVVVIKNESKHFVLFVHSLYFYVAKWKITIVNHYRQWLKRTENFSLPVVKACGNWNVQGENAISKLILRPYNQCRSQLQNWCAFNQKVAGAERIFIMQERTLLLCSIQSWCVY